MSSASLLPPVVVRVTEADLEQGRLARADACPLARAISHVLRIPVLVGRYWVTRNDGSGLRCPLPPEARAMLLRWDSEGFSEPGEFVLSHWEEPRDLQRGE